MIRVAKISRATALRVEVIISPTGIPLKFLALVRFSSYLETPPYLPEPRAGIRLPCESDPPPWKKPFKNSHLVIQSWCLIPLSEKVKQTYWPAQFATPQVMRRLRNDCGGLLFLAIGNEIGEKFDLPWLQDIHTNHALVQLHPVLDRLKTDDLQYDNKSAFTLSINHRDTFTGITDRDRALTTRRFGELSGEVLRNGLSNEEAQIALGEEFEPPGTSQSAGNLRVACQVDKVIQNSQ